MSVNYSDFARVAEQLQLGETEIEWRMGAGRAYYAAFHRANSSACACPDNSQFAMGSHARVSDRFKLEGSIPAKSIAYILIAMKKIRTLADYDLDDSFNRSACTNQISQYRALEAKLDAFDNAAAARTG